MSSKHIARLAQNSFWRSRTFAQTLGACRWRDHAIVLLESRRRTTGPQGQNRLFSSVSQYPDASPTSKPERAREGPVSTSTSDVALNSALQKKASGRDLVLSPPALVITREYEWANLLVGFEQANRYSIRSAPGGEVVGYLAEVRSIFPHIRTS